MKALFWVIATPLVIIAASFSVEVQHTIEVGVWPLSFIRGVLVYAKALGALGGAVSGSAPGRAQIGELALNRCNLNCRPLLRPKFFRWLGVV